MSVLPHRSSYAQRSKLEDSLASSGTMSVADLQRTAEGLCVTVVELQNRLEGVEEKSEKHRSAEAQLEQLIASLQAEWAGHEKMIALESNQPPQPTPF